MVIWKTEASWDYLSLTDASLADLRHRRAYKAGKLSKWHPTSVDYMIWVSDDTDERHERVPNFPYLSSEIACDAKAKRILQGSIYGHVKFLPLGSETIADRQYFWLRTTSIMGRVVSKDTGIVLARDETKVVFRQRSYILNKKCIDQTPIFRLPGVSEIDVFATDKFKRLVEDNDLTGLVFEMLWEI